MPALFDKPFVEEKAKSESAYHYMIKEGDRFLKKRRQYSVIIEPMNFLIDAIDRKDTPSRVKEVVKRLKAAREQIIKDYKLQKMHKVNLRQIHARRSSTN